MRGQSPGFQGPLTVTAASTLPAIPPATKEVKGEVEGTFFAERAFAGAATGLIRTWADMVCLAAQPERIMSTVIY